MAKSGNGRDGTGKPAPSRFTGTPADRLVRLWRSNDERFDELLDETLDSRRQAVLEAALGKLHEEERPEFLDEVETIAESVRRTDAQGDDVIATLFWLAVEVSGELTQPPSVDAIERALDSSGLLENASDTRLLPAWLDPEALVYLEAADRRALLQRMLTSNDEALRFAKDEELLADPADAGIRLVSVVGLVEEEASLIDDLDQEALPDPLQLIGGDDYEEPELDPVEEERIRQALASFTDAVRTADPRVRRCEPAGGLNDLLDLLAEADWADEGDLGELASFIDVASDETSDAVVDTVVTRTPQGLFVRAYGADGRLLDERAFALDGNQMDQAMALLRQRCRSVAEG
ncbi:hypothetical protein [Azospirillum rugosum]|uniref:DUF2336 domain-containing protein n=1 Tax=Azospirillum rugosum TaxID=416170 RepID=A0ABS4STS8_9PROT|nr:hypothetical protein [Azospirillum rugosum]MBP2295961.1 hypothetical protein [Azospirillum rugosum]MDQ0529551.1 hypothetical protein [Azospirillum rugosum]